MKPLPKKLTFQLTPLLDLLLIVIFAQYMEVRETSRNTMQKSQDDKMVAKRTHDSDLQQIELWKTSSRQSEIHARQNKQRADERESDIERLQQVLNREQQDTADQLKLLAEQRDIVVALASKMFQLPQNVLEEAMGKLMQVEPSRTKEEIEKTKNELTRLSKATNREVLKHFLQFAELRRWCEIWELHVSVTGNGTLTAGKSTTPFIVRDASIPVPQDPKAIEEDERKTIKKMENEFYAFYERHRRSLSQATSVVIVFVTYESGTPHTFRITVRIGLQEATKKMRRNSAGNIRFEYAIMGVLESSTPTEERTDEKKNNTTKKKK